MEKDRLPEYNVYNLRQVFEKQPGDPARCPHCGGPLTCREVEPSEAVQEDLKDDGLIPVHIFSRLFFCDSCGWWLTRERWAYCEIGSDLDYVIIGAPGPSNRKQQPWLAAFADPEVYFNAEKDIPPEVAALFPPNAPSD